MTIEEAAALARGAIYHATFRDAASGGVASGMCFSLFSPPPPQTLLFVSECAHFYFIHNNCVLIFSLLRGTKWMEEAIWG